MLMINDVTGTVPAWRNATIAAGVHGRRQYALQNILPIFV